MNPVSPPVDNLSDSAKAIRAQLASEKTLLKYVYGSDALDPWLTNSLAVLIAQNGCTDIRNIALNKQTVPITVRATDPDTGEFTDTVQNVDVNFYFDKSTGRPFSNIGGGDSLSNTFDENGDLALDPTLFASVQNDDWIASYWFKTAFNGTPYFLISLRAIPHDSGGFFGGVFSAIAPIAPFVALGLAIFAPGAGLALGSAILGDAAAAAAPLLASAVGNVAISTALNGGNIESAVKSTVIGAASGGIGGAVGQTVAAAVDSGAVGTVAAAATSALVRGGDLKTAVLSAALSTTGQTSIMQVNRTATLGDAYGDGASYDPTAPVDTGSAGDAATSAAWSDPSVSLDTVPTGQAGPVIGYHDPVYDVPADMSAGVSTMPDHVPFHDPTYDSGINPGTPVSSGSPTVAQVLNYAMSAVKAVKAWQAAGQPNLRVSTAQATARSDGFVYTNGRKLAPAVGTPYVTADNSVIVNNGDGTFTRVDANGQSVTLRYPVNAAQGMLGTNGLPVSSGLSPLVLIGIAGALLRG